MPKFSSKERERIYKTLLEKGKEMFNEKSIEKTYEKIVKIKLGIHDDYEL